MKNPIFTVFTPTYNRAHLLPRVLECLAKQTFQDFEWVIVDDGSTDGTDVVVGDMIQTAPFPMRYFKKANGGRHTAINRGVIEARGELFAILDSDDLYVPNALERFYAHWTSIPEGSRQEYVGVTGLCNNFEGSLIGSKFPADVFDSDSVSIRTIHLVTGDKKGFVRTDLQKSYPYPDVNGERRVPASLVWNRLARKYRTRFVNEVLTVMDYQKDSLSASIDRVRMRSPRASRLYYQEYLSLGFKLSFKQTLKACANYVRYSFHAHIGVPKQASEAPLKFMWVFSFPVGLLLYFRDKKRAG